MKFKQLLFLSLILFFSCSQTITPHHEHIFDEIGILEDSYTKSTIKYKCRICGYEKTETKQKEHDITIWTTDFGWIKNESFTACKSEGIYIYCDKLAYYNGYLDEKDLKFYYTLDGSEPTLESPMLPAMEYNPCCCLIIEESCILKIFATNRTEISTIQTFQISAIPRVSKPIISTENNCKYLGSGELVSISCSSENALIYYTLDGTPPSESSMLYTNSFYIYENCKISAIAVKSNNLNSTITTYSAIDRTAPSPLQNVSIDHISDTTIKLLWDNPSDADYAGCIISFNDTVIKKDKNTTSFIIDNLPPYSLNCIVIKTFDYFENTTYGQTYSFMTFTPAKNTEKGLAVIPEYFPIIPNISIVKENNTKNTISLYAWHYAIIGQCEYTWYQSNDNINWVQIGTGQDISIEVLDGINYYCASLKNTDTIAYTNSCKIECNTPKLDNIGKIYYKDGTISSDYIDGKEVLGIICNLNPDGSVKNILDITEKQNIKFTSKNDITGDGRAVSMIDGTINTNNIQMAKDFSFQNYPVFDFYLNNYPDRNYFIPSIQEITEAISNYETIDKSLKILKENGLEVLLLEDESFDYSTKGYWSSSSWYGYGYWFKANFTWYTSLNSYRESAVLENPYNLMNLRLMYRIQ